RAFGQGEAVQQVVKVALGIALLLAVAGLMAKSWLALRDRSREVSVDVGEVSVRPIPTLLVGMVGGLIVGMSSVGSGSLIIVALLALYPALKANQLVGTDLVQAVPLVCAAALGHLFFGEFQFAVTTSLVIGSIPGVYLGARISSRAPGGVIRAALAVVLLASALKLLGVADVVTLCVVAAATVLALIGRRVMLTRTPEREPASAGSGGGA